MSFVTTKIMCAFWRGDNSRNAALLVLTRLVALFLVLAAPVAAQAAAVKTKLYSFQGGADGGIPEAGLTADTDGALYGVTSGGPMGSGVVYKLTPPASGATTWTKKTLYAFKGGADGGFPQAGLIFDSNGALYGVTREGGANGVGTIFVLSPPIVEGGAWTKTTLHSFRASTDGARPVSGLTFDTDGALYGTTVQRGARNAGAVYSLTPPAPGAATKTWAFATLYAFQGGLDGANPYGGVVFDTSGALYGTTAFGGHRGAGTVYKLAPPAPGKTAWTKTTLYSFDGVEGNFPRATLTFGTDAAIYGVTYGGGAFNAGTIYKLTPPAAGVTLWTKSTLHNFNGGTEGANPYSPLTFDTMGALYGATYNGGASAAGSVFKLTPPAEGATKWSLALVYSFQGGADGVNPGGLVFDNKGSIYGVTMHGVINWNGSVFQLSLPAAPVASEPDDESVVYGFTGGADGGNPRYGTPVFDTKGAIYATTANGGAKRKGAIVQLSPPTKANPRWTQKTLYSFTGGADGGVPMGCLVFDTDGALYGTTSTGGLGKGVIFRLAPPTAKTPAWTYRPVYTFTGGVDGSLPQCGLVFDTKGSLYGVASTGGLGYGVAFRLKPNQGTEWQYNLLYSFTGKADGAYPMSGLIFDTDGDLYGMTRGGGNGFGVAYRLRPGEHNVNSKFWTQRVLYAFKGKEDGSRPFDLLTFDNHGSLYGVTQTGGGADSGTVFKLSQDDDRWTKTTLYSFKGGADGATPFGVTFDTLGALYGTTRTGGDANNGTVFKLSATRTGPWSKTILNSFKGTDGAAPLAGVLFDTQGMLYGTASLGGPGRAGTIYRLK